MTPYFTVVMPSFLGAYANAAGRRPEKFRRAVDSVAGQSFRSWELVIVSDGCADTRSIYLSDYACQNIHCIPLPKHRTWSTAVRNAGIATAQGEYVLYLDTDDFLGRAHLQVVHDGLISAGEPQWAYSNDLYWDERRKGFTERTCDIGRKFRHGTSNIVHRPSFRWPQDSTYAHDHRFILDLKKRGMGVRIPCGQYHVCHDIEAGKIKFDV